jgi:hypothetical protein
LVDRTIDELRAIEERAPWTANYYAQALCEKCGGCGKLPTDYAAVKQASG